MGKAERKHPQKFVEKWKFTVIDNNNIGHQNIFC